MSQLTRSILSIRESVAAILRIRPKNEGEYEASLVGTAFCVQEDRYLITAFHIFNDGNKRNLDDKFFVFTVPDNGESAFHFPVISVPVERPDVDIAVLEIGPCATAGVRIPAIPLDLSAQPDGAKVVTVGFPAPDIAGLTVDTEGNYVTGQFFLKSHANDGIVSAHYQMNGTLFYEFNVGWHHGESGGPIAVLSDTVSVFSVMQHYRNVQAPYGTVPGPHRGVSLCSLAEELKALGVA